MTQHFEIFHNSSEKRMKFRLSPVPGAALIYFNNKEVKIHDSGDVAP